MRGGNVKRGGGDAKSDFMKSHGPRARHIEGPGGPWQAMRKPCAHSGIDTFYAQMASGSGLCYIPEHRPDPEARFRAEEVEQTYKIAFSCPKHAHVAWAPNSDFMKSLMKTPRFCHLQVSLPR